MYKVLFVCTGNICRSPTAEALFRDLVRKEGFSDRIATDSCGTGAWHVGHPPDPRTVATARRRGVAMDDLRARQLKASDFTDFDLLLAMDRSHLREMTAQCPPALRSKLRLFLDFAPTAGTAEVPDPYYGGPDGFEDVFDLVEEGARGLLAHLKANGVA